MNCPKCGSRMIFIVYNKAWYCLFDGAEIPEAESVDMIPADDPVIAGWRGYL